MKKQILPQRFGMTREKKGMMKRGGPLPLFLKRLKAKGLEGGVCKPI